MYNQFDEHSILNHAKKLENKSLKEFIGSSTQTDMFKETKSSYNTGKGSLGQLVEELVFDYKINSIKDADFKEVGMELKVVPFKKVKISNKSEVKKRGLSVKERIVLSIINYEEIIHESWDTSSIGKKLLKILLMFYVHESGVDKLDLKFNLIEKWEPSESDLKIIEHDWNTIVNKIKSGKAHELSEGDTLYLGAATKGASAKSLREQPNSSVKAKQRAFSLKRSYVEEIVNSILNGNSKGKSDKNILEILDTLNEKYRGKTLKEISESLDIIVGKEKSRLRNVVNHVISSEMGISLKDSVEAKKAGIELKTILLKPDGVPKEHMSFEQIKYDEIIEEDWENSFIRDKFELRKHIWIVFKAKKKYKLAKDLNLDEIELDSVLLWNMPYTDLENAYRDLWEDTKAKINNEDFDSFLKPAENAVGHIRPKATNSKDKVKFRNNLVPKKAFWLNRKYIASEIERLKD